MFFKTNEKFHFVKCRKNYFRDFSCFLNANNFKDAVHDEAHVQ